jgi:hypothetical protein
MAVSGRRGGIEFDMLPLGEVIDEGDLDAALGLAVAFPASIPDRFQHPVQVREVIVAIADTMTGTQPRHEGTTQRAEFRYRGRYWNV